MKRVPLTARHIDMIGIATCVAMTAVAAFTIVEPIRSDRAALVTLESQLAAETTTTDELVSRRDAARVLLQTLEEDAAAERVQLRSASHLNAHLARMTDLVESSGLIIEQTEVGSMDPGMWYQSVPITITGRGTFPDCTDLLHRFAADMQDTGVVGLRMTGNARDGEPMAQVKLRLVWYAAPDIAAGVDPAR